MRLSRASRADWVAKPTSALRLRSVFNQSRIRAANTSSSRAFQPSSIKMSVGCPSSRSSMRWKRYIIVGVRRRGVSSKAVMSKPKVLLDRSNRSISLSNSQPYSPDPIQASRRLAKSPGSGRFRPDNNSRKLVNRRKAGSFTYAASTAAAMMACSSGPSAANKTPSQSRKKARLTGVSSNAKGLKPLGSPAEILLYTPSMPRTNTSAPRSLSNKMVRGENFCAWAARKFMTTVLPDPDGPMTLKLPRSPWWKLKKKGVALVVWSKVTASPQ